MGLGTHINEYAKRKILGEQLSDEYETPSWSGVIVEKGLTSLGAKELATEIKGKRKKNYSTSKPSENEKENNNNKTKGDKNNNTSESSEKSTDIVKKLEKAKKAMNTTKAMAKIADPSEAIAGLIPGLGDGGAGVALGAYYHILGKSVGLDSKSHKKINRYLAIDAVGGFIPVLGDAFDFIYKACKKIAKLFETHYNSLLKQNESELSKEQITNLNAEETIDSSVIEKYKSGKLDDITEKIKQTMDHSQK